jgi:glutathione S-transferase
LPGYGFTLNTTRSGTAVLLETIVFLLTSPSCIREAAMKIYGDMISGNCFKIKLVASLLDIDHQWIAIDIMRGEARSGPFLHKNPNGKVPVIELNDGRYLWESNAIINYLAFDSALFPDDNYLKAKVLQWQFFEQYSHEPYIAVARFIKKFQGLPEDRKDEFYAKQAGGHAALKVMEDQLSISSYLTGEQLTVADISLYAYTHVAHEGEFSLAAYPHIQTWIKRISSHPKYIGME